MAREAGWLRPLATDFSVRGVPDVVDRTRARMAALSADDVTEDEIERTDTVLAGLASRLAIRRSEHVTVFVSDRIAERAVRDVRSASSVGDRTLVVEGRSFLATLVDED